jgi:hypothetical protein
MGSLVAKMPAEERQATSQHLIRLRNWFEKGEKILPWPLKFLLKANALTSQVRRDTRVSH